MPVAALHAGDYRVRFPSHSRWRRDVSGGSGLPTWLPSLWCLTLLVTLPFAVICSCFDATAIKVLFRLRIRAKLQCDSEMMIPTAFDLCHTYLIIHLAWAVCSNEGRDPCGVDQRIDTAFTTHGSTSGSSSQAPGRAVTFKDFMACQPPHFEGRKDPIACFRWVAAVEGAFRTSGCPEGMKVFYAVNLLRNAGKDWWGLILKSRTEEQINAMTWDEFKVLLDEQFAPRIEKQRITSEFLNLAQTTETVNEITDQFLEKSLFCPDYVNTEEMKMFRYQGVLKPEIQEFVATARCKTFNDMVDVARTRELFLEEQQQGKRKAEQEPVPVKKSKGQRSDGRKEFSGCPKCGKNHSGECRLPEPVCFKCGKPGHRSRECRVEPRTCFHCFQPGHIKPNCPQLIGAAAAATPVSTPLMITDGSTGKKSGSTTGGRGRAFQLTAEEMEADPDVVAGVVLVSEKPALVLFDTGATWSFVSNIHGGRGSTGCEDVYQGCSLVIHGVPFSFDLIPTPTSRTDVNVGVDWMFRNRGNVDCAEQVVCIRNPSGGELIVYGEGRRRQLGEIVHVDERLKLHREAGCGARVEGEKAGNQGDSEGSVAELKGFRVDLGAGSGEAGTLPGTFLGLISGTKS
ncbi:hypothetical protein OSB04_013479 [Centaurea solstitialis]|uniref:CCHC-type domain-containing protein n=1 Tax=Centaurea solstitialis TaxID=347529 RepID=A0AA38TQ15_9ASTR|nr:hypothetical protein OSB04_013479 [Centaurea solstitialis]